MIKADEPMLVQALVSQPAIEAFYVCVLYRKRPGVHLIHRATGASLSVGV